MKPLLRALALGVGPVAAALGVGMLAQGQPPPQFVPPSALSTSSCAQPPVFKTAYEVGPNYVKPLDEGFHFGGNSMLEGGLCSAGTLKITAAGDVAGDEEPQLTVFFDGKTLDAPRFDRERIVELRIPKAGQLFLGFFNDYYETDSRVVFLREMKLFGKGCQDYLSPQYEKDKGINFNPEIHAASLSSELPLTFTPCREGKLRFRVLGRKGKDALPVFQISQGNEVLYKHPVDIDWKAVQLDVKRQPMTLRLLNPYWKTLGDRNIDVKRIEFIPDTTSAQSP